MEGDRRERIIRLVRALWEKTEANGCTKDEAITASDRARELLTEYNLTVQDVEVAETPFKKAALQYSDWVGERLWKVARGIKVMVGVNYWVSDVGQYPITISWFGFDHEVEVAKYLLAIVQRAMLGEQKRFERANALKSPQWRRMRLLPFLDGMADELERRIAAMKPTVEPGSGLVLMRTELIKKGMKDFGINLRQRDMRASRDGDSSYGDGVEAGRRVNLHMGITRGSDFGPLPKLSKEN